MLIIGNRKKDLAKEIYTVQNKTTSPLGNVLFSVAVPLVALQNIYAYIDAGTGSLIIQVLIASTVAGLFFVRAFWRRIKVTLQRWFAVFGKSK